MVTYFKNKKQSCTKTVIVKKKKKTGLTPLKNKTQKVVHTTVIWLVLLNLSSSSSLPHKLLVMYLLGDAHNLKLEQRRFKILGCYRSINKLTLYK